MNKLDIFPAFPEGRIKAFTLSYDDGNDCDRPLVEMMRRCGVKGTFNINSELCPPEEKINTKKRWRRMTMQECLDLYGDDMEIAVHGATHAWWARCSSEYAMADILNDKRNLERATGRIIRGAAFPEGNFNSETVRMLHYADIAYCRTVNSTGKFTFEPTGDFCAFRPTCRHRDPQLNEITQRFLTKNPSGKLWLYYVWGHSFEFVADNNWDIMEKLLSDVSGRDDIWYATNIEIFDYAKAFSQLHFNTDMTLVRNDSARPVWLRAVQKQETEIICIPGGATVTLSR